VDLSGETFSAIIRNYRNGTEVAAITATLESYSTPTFDELIADNPEFILPPDASGSDAARLAEIRLIVPPSVTADLPLSNFARGSDVTFAWDLYATNSTYRIFAGDFIVSEGSSYA